MMADRIVGGENRRGVRDVSRPPWPFLSPPHAAQRRGGAPIPARTGASRGLPFESMAAVVEGGCPQQFQHFISCSPWDHEPVVAQIGQDADRLLGGKPTSALIIDESSFPKQGDRSVGVARQWAGRRGRGDNCQVAMFGVLTDGERHTPIDMRLYLPQGPWIDDPGRCDAAGVPEAARTYTSKSAHALD